MKKNCFTICKCKCWFFFCLLNTAILRNLLNVFGSYDWHSQKAMEDACRSIWDRSINCLTNLFFGFSTFNNDLTAFSTSSHTWRHETKSLIALFFTEKRPLWPSSIAQSKMHFLSLLQRLWCRRKTETWLIQVRNQNRKMFITFRLTVHVCSIRKPFYCRSSCKDKHFIDK